MGGGFIWYSREIDLCTPCRRAHPSWGGIPRHWVWRGGSKEGSSHPSSEGFHPSGLGCGVAEGSSHIKWFIKKNLVLFRPQKHGFEWFWRQLLILLLPVSDGDIWWSLIRRSLITWLQLEVRIKRLKSANFLNWCCNQMAGYNKSNCFGRFLSQKNQRHWHLEQWRHPRPLFSCRYFNAQLQIFQCRAKKYFNAEQRNISMQSKEMFQCRAKKQWVAV